MGIRTGIVSTPAKCMKCSDHFSPLVEMASVDEAYLDMTGTERLHGRPLRSAHRLHDAMKSATQLNCSIGIGTSRLVAKVSSAKAKPNGVLWISPDRKRSFSRRWQLATSLVLAR